MIQWHFSYWWVGSLKTASAFLLLYQLHFSLWSAQHMQLQNSRWLYINISNHQHILQTAETWNVINLLNVIGNQGILSGCCLSVSGSKPSLSLSLTWPGFYMKSSTAAHHVKHHQSMERVGWHDNRENNQASITLAAENAIDIVMITRDERIIQWAFKDYVIGMESVIPLTIWNWNGFNCKMRFNVLTFKKLTIVSKHDEWSTVPYIWKKSRIHKW